MKKIFRFFSCAALLFGTVALSACGSDEPKQGPTYATGDTVYEDKIIYDSSKEAYAVSVKLDKNKSVTAVSCGRAKGDKLEFGVKNQVLTLQGSFMEQIGSGEKQITVTYSDDSKEKIDALIATKVITTAQEFQDINENLKGVYVLGNDIDLSSIPNFEPLGYYYDETSTKNDYFHGILEGNGYTVKNANVYYCSSTTSAEEVYNNNSLFKEECHQSGNNIGLFQIIGSSGVVRNVVFDNIKVRGKTIVGVVAGNVSGLVENCIITETCSAQMGTHFYDNDCNMGGVAGIVAGSGIIRNTICLTSNLTLPNTFKDYSSDYIGKIGNGWDHTAQEGNTDPSWQFANVDRPLMNYSSGSPVDSGAKEIDSNGVQTNGKYAFAGKTWGVIENCYAISYTNTVYEGQSRDICFTQTHLAANKPGSGDTDLGTVIDSYVKTAAELKDSTLYAAYDTNVWNITNGNYPTLSYPVIKTYIA